MLCYCYHYHHNLLLLLSSSSSKMMKTAGGGRDSRQRRRGRRPSYVRACWSCILYYALLYHTTLCYTILYYTRIYHMVKYTILSYSIICYIIRTTCYLVYRGWLPVIPCTSRAFRQLSRNDFAYSRSTRVFPLSSAALRRAWCDTRGKGQMGSTLMGSLQISCFLTEGLLGHSR